MISFDSPISLRTHKSTTPHTHTLTHAFTRTHTSARPPSPASPQSESPTSAVTYTLKKLGLSRAEWKRTKVEPRPGTKLRKAYDWLMANNATYRNWVTLHNDFLLKLQSMENPHYWIRTSDLLLKMPGIEVAAYPLLYPRASFADTDLREKGLLVWSRLYGSYRNSELSQLEGSCLCVSARHNAPMPQVFDTIHTCVLSTSTF